MFNKIKNKLGHSSGESVGETLIALLIASLAMMMLAGTISSASRLITRSRHTLGAYYTENNNLAKHETQTGTDGSVTLSDTDMGGTMTVTANVKYYVNSIYDDIVSYEKK